MRAGAVRADIHAPGAGALLSRWSSGNTRHRVSPQRGQPVLVDACTLLHGALKQNVIAARMERYTMLKSCPPKFANKRAFLLIGQLNEPMIALIVYVRNGLAVVLDKLV